MVRQSVSSRCRVARYVKSVGGRCRAARSLEELESPPRHIGLQPLSHTVAASVIYGCSLCRIRLQATVSLKDLSLPGVPGVLLPGEPPDEPPDEAPPQPFLTPSRRPGGPREE